MKQGKSQIAMQCDAIVAYHENLGRQRLGKLLNLGLAQKDVDKELKGISFEVPQSLKVVYTWRNGTKQGLATFNEMWLLPGYYLLSLEDAIRNFKLLIEHNPQNWKSSWFPFMCSGSGDFYAIQGDRNALDDGRILKFLRGEPEVVEIYSSLRLMLRTIDACFKKNVFYVADDGFLEVNDDEYVKVAEKTKREYLD